MSPIAKPIKRRWAEDVAELEVSRDVVEATITTHMTTNVQEAEVEASIEQRLLPKPELLQPRLQE